MEGDGDVGVVTERCSVGRPALPCAGQDEGLEGEDNVAASLRMVSLEDALSEFAGCASVQQLVSGERGLEAAGGESPFTDEVAYVVCRYFLSGEFLVIVEQVSVVEPRGQQDARRLEAL